MAADAEQLAAQAARIVALRKDKERREGKTISQETAAHEIGVSVRQYRTWETSGADMKIENLKALADYYSTSIDLVQRGKSQPSATPELVETLNGQAAIADLAREIAKLRQAVERQAEMIAERAAARMMEMLDRLQAERRLTPEQNAELPPPRSGSREATGTGSDPTGPQP